MGNHELEKIDHRALMGSAKNALTGKWGLAVSTTLLYLVILSLGNVAPAINLLVGGAFSLGFAIFSLNIARDNSPKLEDIFDGFKQYVTSLGAYLLIMIAVILGILLFIIPGIIIGLGLSQTYYIIANDSEIGPVDALKKSWEMMDGRKVDYFILYIRFIPWFLLSILTLFIGLLWLIPYMQVTFAKYHDKINPSNGDWKEFMTIEDHLVDY